MLSIYIYIYIEPPQSIIREQQQLQQQRASKWHNNGNNMKHMSTFHLLFKSPHKPKRNCAQLLSFPLPPSPACSSLWQPPPPPLWKDWQVLLVKIVKMEQWRLIRLPWIMIEAHHRDYHRSRSCDLFEIFPSLSSSPSLS